MTEIKSAALELGTERIRKLLVQYAVPAIIAMTASSLYNMVDSIFIGHGVGPLASATTKRPSGCWAMCWCSI